MNESRKIKLIVFQERDRKEVFMKKINFGTKGLDLILVAKEGYSGLYKENLHIKAVFNIINKDPECSFSVVVEGHELPPVTASAPQFKNGLTEKQLIAVLNSYISKLISLGY